MTRRVWPGLLALLLVACPAKDKHSSKAEKDSGAVKSAQKPTPAPKAPPPERAWAQGAAPNQEVIAGAIADLSAWVETGATDPKNAWAMAHGLLAFGKDHKASDGRLMIDVIVRDYAQRVVVDGVESIQFPKRGPDGQVAEVHSDLMAKSLLEAGVSLDRKFELRDGSSLTMRDIVASVARRAKLPTDDKAWHDFAWTAGTLLAASEQDPKILEGNKHGLTLKALASGMLDYTVREQSFLEPLLDAGRPELVQKRKQMIYSHFCGGLHVVTSGVQAAKHLKSKRALEMARRQVALVEFRYEAERRIYQDSLKKMPEYRLLLLVQTLKFYGHALETIALAKRWGVLDDSPATKTHVEQLVSDVFAAMRMLAKDYQDLAKVRKIRNQSYLDMIGDGCHAIHGLRQASVAFFAPS